MILRAGGEFVNRKRVHRLMRLMGIAALGPKPRTSKRDGGGEHEREIERLHAKIGQLTVNSLSIRRPR